MPRLTDATRAERRAHVLTSAWVCFSRNGYHQTSMDDVIAETGMSSSSVYRYFRSKDDLIDAAAQDTMAQTYSAVAELLDQEPVPGPAQTLVALVNNLRSRRGDEDDPT